MKLKKKINHINKNCKIILNKKKILLIKFKFCNKVIINKNNKIKF